MYINGLSRLTKVSYSLLLACGATAATVLLAAEAQAETSTHLAAAPTDTPASSEAVAPTETITPAVVAPQATVPQPVSPTPQAAPPQAQRLAEAPRPSQQAKDLLQPTDPAFTVTTAPSNWTELAQNPAPTDPRSRQRSAFYFGSRNPDPNVLAGPTREQIVPAADPYRGGFGLGAGGQINISPRQHVNLEVRGGATIIGAEASYFVGTNNPRQGLNMNVFGAQSFSPSFRGGDRNVRLPAPNNDRDDPVVDRLGGGVQWLQPLAPKLDSAFGISYQRVAIREGFFSDANVPFDAQGNPLSVSSTGRDDLLALGAALKYDTRDFAGDPRRGTHLRFGLDQSLPVGDAKITMTRLSLSAAQFVPLTRGGGHTLVLSAQGGHMFGDVPGYEAFNLGGMNSVRGYGRGEVGTGASFVQASMEYRFPLFGFKFLRQDVKVRGMLFADYGSTLGSQDEVIGRPGVVRDKPGSGFGAGAGARIRVGPAVTRFEVGVSDQGDVGVYFGLGERF
jgi:outer membrane protein insertion porin family